MDNIQITLLPGIRALSVHPVGISPKGVPGFHPSYMLPSVLFFEGFLRFVIGDPGLLPEQRVNLFIRHLDYRSADFILGDPLQQEFFFFLSQFFLLVTCSRIKDLIQIDLLRNIIRGKQKSIAAVFIEIALQHFQCLRITLRDLSLNRMGKQVLFR